MQTQIIIATKLGYIDEVTSGVWIKILQELGAMIFGLARSLGKVA